MDFKIVAIGNIGRARHRRQAEKDEREGDVRGEGSGLDLDEVGGRLGIEFRGAMSPARDLRGVVTETVEQEADVDGALYEVIDLQRAGELDGLDPVKAAADGATALGAVGRTAENARFNAALQVGRIIGGHFGEKAIVGVGGRLNDSASNALVREELRIFIGEGRQLTRNEVTIFGGKHLGALLAELGSVQADPNTIDFGARAPKGDVFLEVTGAGKHLASDGPMNVDFAAFDIFEDAFISGGLAANVVMFG